MHNASSEPPQNCIGVKETANSIVIWERNNKYVGVRWCQLTRIIYAGDNYTGDNGVMDDKY